MKAFLSTSNAQKKMIFVDSNFVGCHSSKQMDDEVFTLPQVCLEGPAVFSYTAKIIKIEDVTQLITPGNVM